MIKLITATNLQQWAATRDSEGLMPELIRRLIHSSVKGIKRLNMPTEDSVSLPGFDGVLETSSGNGYVSEGTTVFEVGTNGGIKKKADGDINTRSKEVADEEKEKLNFVFVTPRRWRNARAWEKVNSDTQWKSVRALTAVELEDWISQCPSVAVWLATKMGQLCDGINIDSLEGYWERWSLNAKGQRLDYGILTGGREKNVGELIEEISQPNIVSIVSGATEESLAFAVAAILETGKDALIDRCVIAHDAKAIKDLMTSYKDLVIITSSDERSFSYGVERNRDSVVYATNLIEQSHHGTSITLKSHDYHQFQEALEKSGLTEVAAKKVAKDSGRNVMVLRHQLEFDLTNPSWTRRDDLIKVIPVLLLGRWNEGWEGDWILLEELTGLKREETEQMLQQWQAIDNSPIQKVNKVWYITSPYETFLYIQDYISSQLLDRFETVLRKALTDLDPNAVDKVNPNTAVYTIGERIYSNLARKGMCLNLILIALQAKDGQSRVDLFVKNVLESSTKEWWLTYSSSDVVSYLAEASPKSFIEYIEKNIKAEQSVIRELFAPIKKNSFFTGGYEVEYTQILFALEMLAWMPEYLLRVSCILCELSKIPNESNYTNKPFNSLKDIYRHAQGVGRVW